MELYHALNRGVEKRDLFLDDEDRTRFVHNLWEFNDTKPAPEFLQYRDLRNPDMQSAPRERIVDLHGWCLMGNHYHLLLSERLEGGTSLFLRKLNVGYANYFNKKYQRSGALFQGRTKKKHIDSDAYFLHILHYIHLNPLDFLSGADLWRERKVVSAGDALAHLASYRWSSYLDYCNNKNFPSLISKDLFSDVFPNYKNTISLYLRDIQLHPLKHFLLE